MDDDLIDHMIERQLRPQIRAEEMGVETRLVATSGDHEGIEVACWGCGRTSTMLGVTREEIEGKVILCPDCIPE